MKFTYDEINSANTWQIGTGDDTRSYLDIFFSFGVALVGPGYPGKEGDLLTEKFYSEHPQIRNWGATMRQIKRNQWLIARKGKGFIMGLGKVIEEYDYSNIFNDIEGWDLQHYVKVKWYKPKTDNDRIELGSYCLSQSTIQGCFSDEAYRAIYNTDFEEVISQFDVEQLSDKELSISDIVDTLVQAGVRIQDADNVGLTLQRIIRLTNYYISYHYDVSEAEIITFLIAPTLIALGWSEQKIKFQINNIDIAVYEEAYDHDRGQIPEIIIEAKKFSNGLAFTHSQIKNYAMRYPKCKKFVATNGFRYKYFELQDGELTCKGLFNLLTLKERDLTRSLPYKSIQTMMEISNFFL